jgi:sugar phosphate permease
MSGIPKATPRLKSIQIAALAMLVVAGVINYIDRATLAVANPLIREELGLSIADMGYLLSAFLWAYAFAQLPTGAMVDKIGPRILLALGLSLWSFAQLLGGLVQGFGQFFGARLLLGVGEAPQFPTCARVVRDWFNLRVVAGYGHRRSAADLPDAVIRLAHDVRRHGGCGPGDGGGLVPGLSQPY